MSVTSRVVARRIGRIGFGIALAIGAGYLAHRGWCDHPFEHWPRQPPPTLDAATIVAVTWLAAAATGVVAWAVASRIRFTNPRALAAEGLMAPIVGLTLLLPITLHMPLVIAIGGLEAYDLWVTASLWITGFAHLVFAGLAALRAHQLAGGQPAWSPRRIYALTVIASCIPFVVLFAIPPLLVAATAMPLVALLHRMEYTAAREHAELAGALALPRAIAVGSRADRAARSDPASRDMTPPCIPLCMHSSTLPIPRSPT